MQTTSPSVADVFADILEHPYLHLVKRWNWKSAATGAILRGSIFFFTNLRAGMRAAVFAMLADLSYRAFLAGFNGSVAQSVRKAKPAWAATLCTAVLLPVINHSIEFTVHYLRGTPKLWAGIITSMIFTVMAVLFNLYAMRHGVLLVDEERKPFWQDMARMPRIIGGFLAVIPVAIWRAVKGQRSVAVPVMADNLIDDDAGDGADSGPGQRAFGVSGSGAAD